MNLVSVGHAQHLTRAFKNVLDHDQAARRRLWRDRKRAWRFLRAGGVIVREEHGGSVGLRWTAASRSGRAFDTPICERWLARERIAPVLGLTATFAWVERVR